MRYIDKIDESFVKIFAVKYAEKYLGNLDTIMVRKAASFYEIVFKMKDLEYKCPISKSVVVSDFDVFSHQSFEQAIISRAWRVALYKEFGDKYLEDLQNHINKEHEKTYKKKLSETNQLIKKIKDGKYDGYVK